MGTLAVSVGHGAVCRKTELEDLQSICGQEAERAYVETEASVFILVTCVSNDGELPVCRPRLPLGWGHWRTSASALQLSPSSLLELFPPALPESCSLPWPLLKKKPWAPQDHGVWGREVGEHAHHCLEKEWSKDLGLAGAGDFSKHFLEISMHGNC